MTQPDLADDERIKCPECEGFGDIPKLPGK